MNDIAPNLDYYHPSGTAPIAGTLATLLVGIISGVVLAAAYSFINHHDPLVYLNVILADIFGASIGWVLSKCIHKFRIRNVVIAAVITILVFTVSYAAHWAVYVSAVLIDWSEDYSSYDIITILSVALDFLTSPADMLETIRYINDNGVWNITSGSGSRSGPEIRGAVLWAIWAAEAAVIFYFCVKEPLREAAKPYSERLDEWMEAKLLPSPIAFIDDVNEFKNTLARGNYGALTTPLPSGAVEYESYAAVTLYPDPSSPYVSVQNNSIKAKRRKKKKADFSTKYVVRYLKIPPTAAQSISDALA
jgi:hypothetical protein